MLGKCEMLINVEREFETMTLIRSFKRRYVRSQMA